MEIILRFTENKLSYIFRVTKQHKASLAGNLYLKPKALGHRGLTGLADLTSVERSNYEFLTLRQP